MQLHIITESLTADTQDLEYVQQTEARPHLVCGLQIVWPKSSAETKQVHTRDSCLLISVIRLHQGSCSVTNIVHTDYSSEGTISPETHREGCAVECQHHKFTQKVHALAHRMQVRSAVRINWARCGKKNIQTTDFSGSLQLKYSSFGQYSGTYVPLLT